MEARSALDAAIEILLLKRKGDNVWETLVKPGKKAKVGTRISFGDGLLVGEVIDIVEEGNRLIRFEYEGIFEEILDKLGEMPSASLYYPQTSGQKPVSDRLPPNMRAVRRLLQPAFILQRSFFTR